MLYIDDLPRSITIGRSGENNFTEHQFDVSAWVEDYPNATFALVFRNPSGTIYNVVSTRSENIITWKVTSTELTAIGTAQLEIRMTSGTTLGKSATIACQILSSINGDMGTIPSPLSPYADAVAASATAAAASATSASASATSAAASATAAEEAAEHNPYIDSTTKHWMVWDTEEEEYIDTNVVAEGTKGEKGDPGTSAFNDLTGRPQYNGAAMTSSTNIPEVKTSAWDAKQDATDQSLPTTAKTVVGAIGELKEDIADKQAQNLQRTVTIAVADWNSGTTCTKTVSGVTASNTVIVDSSDATVTATAQATDSLTFTATATPTAEVTVKVVILP